MRYRLGFICSLLLLTCGASALEIPADKAVIELTPKFGPVTFSHLKHSQLDDVTCATCHHPLLEKDNQPVQPCGACHTESQFTETKIKEAEPADQTAPTASIPKAREAFHTLCRSCHERLAKQGQPSGPHDSCRDCHK